MRRIISAISVLALAFSLVASATPANAAVAGYDSAYAGESAFLTLAPGQTGTFTVFFANTGSTSWVRGTGSQVDLAACLDNKVTCNAQDATEAPFNSGWLSATRYASTTQTTVAPGQIGTFTYNVMVPAAQAAGTYRFNGAVVLASTGADIRNEGYYQDVTVGGAAGTAAITSLTPSSGSTAGGNSVVIAGSGFVCNPTTPTVMFGTNTATVTSCGAGSITASAPAGAVGPVTVTVMNTGGAASNGLTYTYNDTARPNYTSVTVTGNTATVTFSEPVCNPTAANTAPGDWYIVSPGFGSVGVLTDSIPTCNGTTPAGVTSATLLLGGSYPVGAFVTLTLQEDGAAGANVNIVDLAGNTSVAPRANTTTAAAGETTAPTLVSASGTVGSTSLKLTFSEPIFCPAAGGDAPIEAGDVTVKNSGGTVVATSTNTNAVCPTTAATAVTSFTVTLDGPLTSAVTTADLTTVTTNEIRDVSGNNLGTPKTVAFTPGAQDLTPPTLTDTRVLANLVTTDFDEATDSFTITFSEAMDTTTAGDQITVSDADGTSALITCGLDATCTFTGAGTVITVTFTGAGPVLTETATSVAGLQLPATIQILSGFGDTAGNVPNLAGSADRVIDVE